MASVFVLTDTSKAITPASRIAKMGKYSQEMTAFAQAIWSKSTISENAQLEQYYAKTTIALLNATPQRLRVLESASVQLVRILTDTSVRTA
jgi:hypothetical protein